MITVASSRSGVSYAETDTVRIHSSYDPVKEAEKYLKEHASASSSTLLLLGPGLNYLGKVLLKTCPQTRVISIYYDTFFYREGGEDAASSWHPGSDEQFLQFMRSRIDEVSFQGMTVIEWPPSATAFPEVARRVNTELAQFAREMNGSIIATAAFGKKWFTNAFHNAVIPECIGTFVPGGKPVVIAAAGPSLSRSCSVLNKMRNEISLWALPSSLMTLNASSLIPDLIISTDAGFYSSFHFSPCRHFPDVPVAMPLTAYPVSHLTANPLVPLTQSSAVETMITGETGIQAVSIIPHGTVTGSALSLALQSQAKSIVFAGFDCCFRDIIEHTRPHSFDAFLTLHATKLAPEYSLLYHRAREQTTRFIPEHSIRTSLPLETYAGWFNGRSFSSSSRLYRLHPSPVNIESLLPLDDTSFIKMISFENEKNRGGDDIFETQGQPVRGRRRQQILQLQSRLKQMLSLLRDEIVSTGSVIPLYTHKEIFPLLSSIFISDVLEVAKCQREQGENNRIAAELAQNLIEQGISLLTRMKLSEMSL